MAWDRVKGIFSRGRETGPRISEITWVEATGNPWGVPVLDVRPVTLTMVSVSGDRQCAANAASFGQDDGTGFIGEEPPVARAIDVSLRFPIDRLLAEGVLFIPREMEEKWAIFYYRGQIICVRSWQRRVRAVAAVEEYDDHILITKIRGTLVSDDEDPALTARVLDYLLRSHALETVYPAPLPAGLAKDPKRAAMWCMSKYGNRALYATPHDFDRRDPEKPLRTHSLLHIAVARGDVSAIEARLTAGTPLDLLAGDGLAPLHWALACKDASIIALLLDRGSPVDVQSAEGVTPLMNAVQSASIEKVSFLLDHGADPNARDRRGFTALHRAAEMGQVEIARVLLDRGASPDPRAGEHTPRSLAEARGEASIVALLSRSSTVSRS